MGPEFIHLNVKTRFSLLESMLAPKKLGKELGAREVAALGVTEIGNIFSAVEVSKYLPENGVQPILGAELRVRGEARDGVAHTLSFIVQNAMGWKHLSQLVSLANAAKISEVGEEQVGLADVLARAEGLICLSGPMGRGWGYGAPWVEAESFLDAIRGAFGDRFYLQLERHGWEDEKPRVMQRVGEEHLLGYARKNQVAVVATNDVRFLKAKDREACEALLCIEDGTILDDPSRRKLTNDHYLKMPEEMAKLFADIPSAITNTVLIAQRCGFLLSAVSVKQMFMPKYTPIGHKDGDPFDVNEELRKQSYEGMERVLREYVYPLAASAKEGEYLHGKTPEEIHDIYAKQLEYELETIITMGFPGYFLITSDFIRWAKVHDIPVGPGRGSGAGSLVAWSLQITDLDPLRWGLYFERFLNPDRVSLPDFDIDFCQDRREEVIAYVRERFGHDRVSQIITFGTLKAKACLRDVGRVLGMGYGEVGQIAAFVPEGANPPTIQEVLEADERLKEIYDTDENVQRLVDTALQVEGCYRHASTHAAGVIITDRAIADVCGLYVDPRSNLPATQLSMNDAEYCGLVKFDFLGLKTLSVIKMGCDMVKQLSGIRNQESEEKSAWVGPDGAIDILKIPLTDQPTFDEVKKGHTIGIFQIESAGMTELTKRMKADDLEALSALVALYRPGPLGTGMVDDYINCRLGKKAPEYPHPVLTEALEATFGVPVYQEQIMRMARDLAGYTLGGADLLRRAMGKKKPEEMAKERAKFVGGSASAHGVSEEQANGIFDLMETFAGYGFNKAHSLAYALISYQTAWLKAHHPMEFMAATMTYDRGNTDKLLRYKQELSRMKAELKVPDVNSSGVYFTVEEGGVRHALTAIKGTGEEAMKRLVAERKENGVYHDMWDLLARCGPDILNKKQVEVLAKSGALDSLGKVMKLTRALLVANVDIFVAYCVACAEQRDSGQGGLFGEADDRVDVGPYQHSLIKEANVSPLQILGWEQEVLGFYLSDHPLGGMMGDLKNLSSFKPLSEIERFAERGGGNARVAGVVLGVREVKTKAGARMGIISLSDPSGQGEVVLFPEAYAQLHELVHGKEALLFAVQVRQDGERIRVSSEDVRPLKDVIGAREQVVIKVPDGALLPRVQALLDHAGSGSTKVTLKLPTPQGEAVVKLPRGVMYGPTLVAGLKQLGIE